MSEQQTSDRPPTSGPGSGVTAWREYAAKVTQSPLESWAALSREEIIALLDNDGTAEQAGDGPDAVADSEREADLGATATRTEHTPRPRQRPVWMVPTEDGDVPEHDLRGR